MSAGRCTVRRGFFVLRGCGQPAVAACVVCGRPVCAEHVVTTGNGPCCIECQARMQAQQESYSWRDRSTAYAYRDRYYSTYTPGHYGHHFSYDDSDHAPFDQGPSDPAHDDEPGGGGFYDS